MVKIGLVWFSTFVNSNFFGTIPGEWVAGRDNQGKAGRNFRRSFGNATGNLEGKSRILSYF